MLRGSARESATLAHTLLETPKRSAKETRQQRRSRFRRSRPRAPLGSVAIVTPFRIERTGFKGPGCHATLGATRRQTRREGGLLAEAALPGRLPRPEEYRRIIKQNSAVRQHQKMGHAAKVGGTTGGKQEWTSGVWCYASGDPYRLAYEVSNLQDATSFRIRVPVSTGKRPPSCPSPPLFFKYKTTFVRFD